MASLRIRSLLVGLVITPAPHAAQVVVLAEAGITGVVRAPDGSPVTHGNVALLTTATNHVTAVIDRFGHFRVVTDLPGKHRLFIAVPGFAPHRLHLTVPPSRIMALPDITLHEATYFRARFVTTEGEPLGANGLRRRSLDSAGVMIPDPLGHAREQIDADGSITIGPLPAGRMLLAFDRSPFAQTRVRDVDVTGVKPLRSR